MLTFKQCLLENSVKPKVVYDGPGEPIQGYQRHSFQVTHPSLSHTAHVDVIHDMKKGKGHTDIYSEKGVDDDKPHMNLGHLGASNIKHVLGRMKHHLPNGVTHLSGTRVTGARQGKLGIGKASIQHIKPIPPDSD